MSSSTEQRLLDLTNQTGQIDETVLAEIFDNLKPVESTFMIGEWEGGSFDTGHPGHKQLTEFRWAGKNFRSVDDVDPIILYDESGKRYWGKDWGHAQLRDLKYRGVVSAAMIYDTQPIIDSFRYVTDDFVLGAMDNKLDTYNGVYYFTLKRITNTA